MFGKRLNQTRKSKGFTAQYMADNIGYSIGAYRMYESSKRYPPLEVLVKIADILDVPVDYLLCRDSFITSHEAYADGCLTTLQANPK